VTKPHLTYLLLLLAILGSLSWQNGLARSGGEIPTEETGHLVKGESLNSRIEKRSEYPAGERVVSADLGYEHFFNKKEDPKLLTPDSVINAPRGILGLKVRAYPLKAVCSQNDQQTIFIIVQDQKLVPVVGAQITLALNIPGKEEALYIVNPVTNEKGISTFTFPFSTDKVGLVQISVRATRDGLEATTTTAFQIWW
jgi:hypothetical protein